MKHRQTFKQTQFVVLLLFCVLVWSPRPVRAAGIRPGIEELYRLDCLPKFKESIKVASISSYDRTGGNNDGFGGQYSFIRKENGGLVLADLKGPGVIYRIWTPTPTDDVMEFYFDGESKPRITVKFRDIFLGKHPAFPRPLVGYGAGGFYSYMPLPYKKSCKVFIKAERMRFYQINYATYPATADIETFSADPNPEQRGRIEKAKKLFASAGEDIHSYAAPEGAQADASTARTVTVKPGGTATLFETNRPGRIVGIRLSPASALMGKKRDIVLRAYWDDDKAPAINCPAGDFFGYAWGEPAMKSLLVGTNGDTDYCYFPMPFDKSARLELCAEPTVEGNVSVRAEVLFVPAGRAQDEGKFYTRWHRENPTTKGKPFTFIETQGRGHLVGVTQQSQGFTTGNTYFFEGDDQTTIDGEMVIHGTGSEDFYNGGWYDVPGRWDRRRSFVLSGCLAYKKYLGRTGAYRLFIGDAYAYHKSLLQTIEHAPANNDLINDYCGVTFLYSENRPTCSFDLPPVAERSVVDPKKVTFAIGWNTPIYSFSLRNATLTKLQERIGGQNARYLSMRAKDGASFGVHSICLTCELPAAGSYKVSIDAVKGPEGAKVQWFMDEAPVGPEVDLYSAEKELAKGLYMGTLKLVQGPNQLMFKLVGKNEQSKGLGLDLANIVCERVD